MHALGTIVLLRDLTWPFNVKYLTSYEGLYQRICAFDQITWNVPNIIRSQYFERYPPGTKQVVIGRKLYNGQQRAVQQTPLLCCISMAQHLFSPSSPTYNDQHGEAWSIKPSWPIWRGVGPHSASGWTKWLHMKR